MSEAPILFNANGRRHHAFEQGSGKAILCTRDQRCRDCARHGTPDSPPDPEAADLALMKRHWRHRWSADLLLSGPDAGAQIIVLDDDEGRVTLMRLGLEEGGIYAARILCRAHNEMVAI